LDVSPWRACTGWPVYVRRGNSSGPGIEAAPGRAPLIYRGGAGDGKMRAKDRQGPDSRLDAGNRLAAGWPGLPEML